MYTGVAISKSDISSTYSRFCRCRVMHNYGFYWAFYSCQCCQSRKHLVPGFALHLLSAQHLLMAMFVTGCVWEDHSCLMQSSQLYTRYLSYLWASACFCTSAASSELVGTCLCSRLCHYRSTCQVCSPYNPHLPHNFWCMLTSSVTLVFAYESTLYANTVVGLPCCAYALV